jgi:hypothetical protein
MGFLLVFDHSASPPTAALAEWPQLAAVVAALAERG